MENTMKTLFRAFLLFAALSLVHQPCDAGPISLQNPFRSYNLSGINYGSEQWERDHAKSKGVQPQPQPAPQRVFQKHGRLRRR
jgi:hypothetical protein